MVGTVFYQIGGCVVMG